MRPRRPRPGISAAAHTRATAETASAAALVRVGDAGRAATAGPTAAAPAAADQAPHAAANKPPSRQNRSSVRPANQQPNGAVLHLLVMSETLPSIQEFTSLVRDDKSFVLKIIQPGLAGLMDGSVSTLAPIFA